MNSGSDSISSSTVSREPSHNQRLSHRRRDSEQATFETGLFPHQATNIEKAAADGAELIIFPETYVPGYPVWIWEMIPGGADDYELGHDIYATLLAQAVTMSGGELDPVRAAVEKAGVYVVLGVHERDEQFSRTTLYNTLVTIGPEGGS